MKHTIARILMAGGVAGGTLVAGNAAAIDWNVTGFVRQEIAVSLGGENKYNSWGNEWNGRVNTNYTYGANVGQAGATGLIGFSGYQDPRGNAANSELGVLNSQVPTSLYVDPATGRAGGLFALEGSIAANALNGEVIRTAVPAIGFNGTYGSTIAGYDPDGNGIDDTPMGLPAGYYTTHAVDCHGSLQAGIDNLTANPPVGVAGLAVFGNQTLDGGTGAGINPRTLNYGADGAGGCLNGQAAGFAPDLSDNTNFNLFSTRIEVDIQAKINDQFSAYMKIRGYADATSNFMDADMGDNYGQADYYGNRRATRLEYNWNDVIVDIPHFYLDWNKGPLWIRVGNQVIAWGEAYFFRTMDVANGLDLRRHLTLGPGAEEYQDQRIASPGIRVSYTFNNGWEIDAFAQMFQPTILPGQNTPYNLIGMSGARFDDSLGQEDAENAINYGFKLNMPLTEAFTGIVAYVNRRDQNGRFVNADAPRVWNGIANTGCAGAINDTLNLFANGALGFAPTNDYNQAAANVIASGTAAVPTVTAGNSYRNNNGCGQAFAPDRYGTPSEQYWPSIQDARLDNYNYLMNIINEFDMSKWAVRDVYGFGDEYNFADTMRTVEGFRSSFGPYIQWVGRKFERENVFMLGGNYLVTSDNEWLDQLIIRGEVSFTPNKNLTNDLSFEANEVDDWVSSLIFEKYQRLSANFPATYMVAQWMHRTSTDLFGRDLDKFDSPDISTFVDANGNFTAAAFDPEAMRPRGTDNANYVVFAFQQPFPNLIWRFDFAVLVDVAGGYLVQPGVRYRPSAKWQWDFYATVIESPGGDNDTITETLDWADEMFVRLTYFF